MRQKRNKGTSDYMHENVRRRIDHGHCYLGFRTTPAATRAILEGVFTPVPLEEGEGVPPLTLSTWRGERLTGTLRPLPLSSVLNMSTFSK